MNHNRQTPQVGDLIYVKIISYDKKVGWNVEVVDCRFDKLKGIILLSNASRRRIRWPYRLARIGELKRVEVLSTDEYLSLSLRTVLPIDTLPRCMIMDMNTADQYILNSSSSDSDDEDIIETKENKMSEARAIKLLSSYLI